MTKTTIQGAPTDAILCAGTPSSNDDVTVTFVYWPAGEPDRRRLAAAGVPRLLIVDQGVAPPADWGVDEEWVRVPVDPEDIRLRVQMLCRRTGASAPDPDSKHVMGSVTPIS